MRAERAERTEAPKVGHLGCFLKGPQRGLDALMCFTIRFLGRLTWTIGVLEYELRIPGKGETSFFPMDHIIAEIVRIIRMKCGGSMSP